MTLTTEPTDAEILDLWELFVGEPTEEIPLSDSDKLCFARAALRSWGQPSGAGEAAEHYRNAIASACEGWTMPDGLRKHLETALWSPSTPQPTQAVPPAGREPLTELQRQAIYDEHRYLGDSGWEVNWSDVTDAVEAAHGIKGKEAGNAE